MTHQTTANPAVIRHPLSPEERIIEDRILQAVKESRARVTGTPRESYDEMSAQTPLATNVALESVQDGEVQGWWIRPADAPEHRAVLFIHGGAYMLGSATGYRGFASQIATRTGLATFCLDYPLAPESPFPAAYQAVLDCLRWLKVNGFTEVALVGDSAGGGLCLASLGAMDANMPSIFATVVFSPWTDLACSSKSFNSPSTHDPLLQPQVLRNAAELYLRDATRVTDVVLHSTLYQITSRRF